MIRETEREEKRRVCIIFDNNLRDDSEESHEAFERAVSDTASLVWYLCRNDYSVKLVTRNKVIGYGTGVEQMHRLMIALALIEATYEEALSLGASVFEGGTGVLITCDHRKTADVAVTGDFVLSEDERNSALKP
jgi:uncharacterized protein (DUF58 family)